MPYEPPPVHGPRPLDVDSPNSARLYDVFLGGSHNTATDRKVADGIAQMAPHWILGARLNRAFLRRAVEFMAAQGIDQFLDLGSGIPTVGNVHEIAQAANPAARCVYVDYESVAFETSKALLADNPNATILHADIRDPASVLDHPDTQALLDFTRPVGLLFVGVLLFLPESDRPGDLIAEYRRRLVPGSYLAISQASNDCPDPAVAAEVDRVVGTYNSVDEQLTLRSREQIESWFAGTELVEPGLAYYPEWRTEGELLSDAQRACRYGYVGVGVVT